ncbi:MAG: hypothetical protein HS115_14030 [Spirochaetales bacterium]|nr:hypothetical protein [Spirochaetales bacterium]
MKYQKIRGPSLKKLELEIRSLYGKDAIVLSTREVPDEGWLGSKIFSRKPKEYEMDFMLPEIRDRKRGENLKAGVLPEIAAVPDTLMRPGFDVTDEEIKALMEKDFSGEGRTQPPAGPDELFHTEKSQHTLERGLDRQPFPASTRRVERGPQPALTGLEPNLRAIESRLGQAHFGPDFVASFMNELDLSLSRLDVREIRKVEERTLERLKNHIRTVPEIAPVSGECRAVMFIGPTGSGKTTTLVKVAARYHFFKRREVSLYSLDHVRLAATEQLKTYAAIMEAPFFAPLDEEEFKLQTEKDGAELLLIDTPGVGFQDLEKMERLASFAQSCQVRLEKHLVLAANTSPYLLERLLLAYEQIGFDKIVLTKLDEGDFIGAFIELADKFSKPFSFLTNGQDVPGAILEAEPALLAGMALKRP